MQGMGKRVLVVDDDEVLVQGLRSLLEFHGYSVLCAADGGAALKLLAAEKFDLLLADLIMPGVEGIELIRLARRRFPDLKIIAMSGSPFALGGKYLEMAGKMGADRTFSKPFVTLEVIEAVHALLKE